MYSISRIWQSNIMEYWIRKYLKNLLHEYYHTGFNHFHNLELDHLLSVLKCTIMDLVLSFLTFISEIIINKLIGKYFNNN